MDESDHGCLGPMADDESGVCSVLKQCSLRLRVQSERVWHVPFVSERVPFAYAYSLETVSRP